jgi:hypothetical protein
MLVTGWRSRRATAIPSFLMLAIICMILVGKFSLVAVDAMGTNELGFVRTGVCRARILHCVATEGLTESNTSC